jgi:predicted transposase YdaD
MLFDFIVSNNTMSTLTFDTHEFVTELKHAGLSESQAEAITRLHQQAANATIDYVKHEHSLENVVTNKDLDARIKETELKIELVKSELKLDIESVRKEIAETKAELIRWVVGVGVLQVTIITALLLKLADTL